MEARAYDDGVAFRYVMPEGAVPSGAFRLEREATEFRLVKDCTAYPIYLDGWDDNYEAPYYEVFVRGIFPDQLVGVPLLIHVPGVAWAAITEARLEDYAGIYLRRSLEPGFVVDLPPNNEEPGLKVIGKLPHQTPWRAILMAPEPGRLIESNMVVNLNPPSAIADMSWIKPGKSSWNWWFGRVELEPGLPARMDMPTMKHMVDFSAEAGFEYMLVDAGWSSRNDILQPIQAMNIEELIAYGRERNVGIWLWIHWTAADRQMEQAFPLYEKWGVKGVKIDFMDRDDQWMVDWYHRTIRLAAQHHLMIDFHGAYKPTGIRRTWPNVMTREGVQGQEYSKWSFGIEPEHNVMLAFTRLLAGPMDFTPGGFDNATREQFVARQSDPMVMGTRAHNLAMFVVYESPFMVVCDHPSAYRGQPGYEFLKAVPATWDETRVLNARVGDYVTIARRNGEAWYVGTMNDWTAREIEIPLSFLGPGSYQAEVYADGEDADGNPKSLSIQRGEVTSATTLTVRLASGGGQAIRISRMPE